MRPAYLFAKTRSEEHDIAIYVNPALRGCDAITRQDKPHLPVYVEIHPRVLKRRRWIVENTLIHEFIHCIEMLYAWTLAKPDPRECTQLAIVFERYFTQMLRNFEMA